MAAVLRPKQAMARLLMKLLYMLLQLHLCSSSTTAAAAAASPAWTSAEASSWLQDSCSCMALCAGGVLQRSWPLQLHGCAEETDAAANNLQDVHIQQHVAEAQQLSVKRQGHHKCTCTSAWIPVGVVGHVQAQLGFS